MEICDRIAGLQSDNQLSALLSGNVCHGPGRVGDVVLPDDGWFVHCQFHFDQHDIFERKGQTHSGNRTYFVLGRIELSGFAIKKFAFLQKTDYIKETEQNLYGGRQKNDRS